MKMRLWKRCFLWLGRIGHCRGFGVQSPTDYRFVVQVILEKTPYYDYESLVTDFPKLDTETRKLCKLFFRLSNYCQPQLFVDYNEKDMSAYAAYVKAGCNKTKLIRGDDKNNKEISTEKPFLVRLSCLTTTLDILQWLLNTASDDSILVIEDIKKNKETKNIWQWIQSNDLVTVTYDLYYCGVIITAKRRYKKNYIINF